MRTFTRGFGILAAELATMRDRGRALADEEMSAGIRSIAAPVQDEQGSVTSAAALVQVSSV